MCIRDSYYTDTRSRASVSVTDSGGDGSLAYNNSTGVITYTGPSSSETRAHFAGGTGVTITDGSVAIGQSVGTTDNVTFNTVTADLTGDVIGDLTGNVTGTVSSISNHDTDNLLEGSNNLYHTAARVRSSVSVTDLGGDGLLTYNNTTGVITYSGPSAGETRAHFSGGTGVTITDGAVAIGQSVGTTDNVSFNTVTSSLIGQVSDISNHNTGDLTEGSNLYYTDTRARASILVTDSGGDGSLAYNNTCLLYTSPSPRDGLLSRMPSSA